MKIEPVESAKNSNPQSGSEYVTRSNLNRDCFAGLGVGQPLEFLNRSQWKLVTGLIDRLGERKQWRVQQNQGQRQNRGAHS